MRRYLLFLYVFGLILSINFTSNSFHIKAQTSINGSGVTSIKSVDIESVSLEKEFVSTVCLMPGFISPEITDNMACSEKNAKIKVSAKTSANNEDELTFYYTVSAGKIIGSGSDVIWDLSRTSPGRYSVTVGAGKDNIIGGKTLTKYITVEDCSCDPPCTCPYNLEITGPTRSVKEGDLIVFSSSNEFSDKDNLLIYDWKITNGEIIEGQGTKQILIRTNQNSAGEKVTVTLEVTSSDCDCPTEEAKTTVNISKKD